MKRDVYDKYISKCNVVMECVFLWSFVAIECVLLLPCVQFVL